MVLPDTRLINTSKFQLGKPVPVGCRIASNRMYRGFVRTFPFQLYSRPRKNPAFCTVPRARFKSPKTFRATSSQRLLRNQQPGSADCNSRARHLSRMVSRTSLRVSWWYVPTLLYKPKASGKALQYRIRIGKLAS